MECSVMTYNIHHGKGIDKKTDLHRIAEVIEKSNADIIGLNEVDKHFSKRSNYEDQVNWLAKQLNMHHAFSPSISLPSKHAETVKQYGNALLSKYPIVNKKNYSFHLIPGLTEVRSLLEVTIQINNTLLRFQVTHLSLNPFLHQKQTDFIINQLPACPDPLIVMGDWNMRPGSRGWRKMTREFQDVWNLAGKGTGCTFPSRRPRSRLDYIFVSPYFQVVETEVVTILSKASDHLPLKAILSF